MGKAMTDFAMQAGQGIVGGLTGLAFGAIADKRQLKQQKKLQQLEIEGNKELSDYNYAKQLQMWKDTNYQAQMKEIKAAGLNPALIYGMSGSGGMTGGGGQSVSGASAPSGGGEGIFMADKAMQIGLMRAQKENIEADTKNKLADANKTAGVDTQEAQSRIQQIAATIKNTEAQTTILEIDKELKSMDAQIKGRTIEDAIDIITATAGTATFETLRTQRRNQIEQATVQSTIQQIQEQAVGALLTNALTQANINVANEQVKKLAAEISQGWKSLDIQETQQIINKWVEENKANNPSIGNVFGKLFNNGLEEIRNVTKPKYKGYSIPTK